MPCVFRTPLAPHACTADISPSQPASITGLLSTNAVLRAYRPTYETRYRGMNWKVSATQRAAPIRKAHEYGVSEFFVDAKPYKEGTTTWSNEHYARM